MRCTFVDGFGTRELYKTHDGVGATLYHMYASAWLFGLHLDLDLGKSENGSGGQEYECLVLAAREEIDR
jgi:hypothetical protein